MDACTVTALDAITVFTVPNPNCSSQSLSVFSGLVALQVAPAERITQPTSDRQLFNFASPFSRLEVNTLSRLASVQVQAWAGEPSPDQVQGLSEESHRDQSPAQVPDRAWARVVVPEQAV